MIATARLELRTVSAEVAKAALTADWDTAHRLIGGRFPDEWRGDDWSWIAAHLALAEARPETVGWGPRLVFLRETGEIVGEAGFHGPPEPVREPRVEIGYMTVSVHRRRGFAVEAVRGLLAWAESEGVTRFQASVDPSNVASAALLEQVGFTYVGRYEHEQRGRQLLYHRG
jgi:ribosomal-protein-alanine N-acetyltransferase